LFFIGISTTYIIMKSQRKAGNAAGPKAFLREIIRLRQGITEKQMYAILLVIVAVSIATGVAIQSTSGGTKAYSSEQGLELAREAVLGTPAYAFGGFELAYGGATPGDCASCWSFVFDFKSTRAGYDGLGMEEPVATAHRAMVTVEDGQITRAVLDDYWDMLKDSPLNGQAPGTGDEPPLQMPNPAAAYCEQAGGSTRNVETPEGQAGFCDLPDGRSCDEWALFRSNGTECTGPPVSAGQFCGVSTNGSCMNSDGCRAGGCSNHVCYSQTEDMPVTTCEWRDCYNASAYGLACACLENRCAWTS